MAQSFDFGEIIDLLNHSKNIAIDSSPTIARPGRWSLHKGCYIVHTSTTEFEVLYVGSKATHDDIDDAARHYMPGSTQVVYANSLDSRARKYHEERLGDDRERFWSTKDYLRSFIRDELKSYLAQLRKLTPQFYTDPHIETPLGVKGKRPNRLLAFLRSPRFENGTAEGLTVLLGEPGQGKTYMSQHLVSGLATSSSLVPIYISSAQWQTMPLDHLGSLQKTIAHSFRHFEAPIAWVEGQEERFLRATLKADLFRVVFDGFDEYILRNQGRLSVSEALEELTELVRATGARIVITSRTSFWESNVHGVDLSGEAPEAIYTICPFDVPQARMYFQGRFGGDGGHSSVDRAVAVYARLAKQDPKFIGRGFILKLVGDLVKGGVTEIGPSPRGETATGWLAEAFCEREVTRQGLPLTASQQLKVFEAFASEVAMGAEPDSETLEVCVHEAAPDLIAEDRVECIKRMEPHPLLEKIPGKDRWRWTEEQVGNVFLARWLCQLATANVGGEVRLVRFLERQSLTDSQMNDLAAMVVNVVSENEDGTDLIAEVVGRILDAARAMEDFGGSRDGRTLAAVVALQSVDHFLPRGSARRERAEHLLQVSGGAPIRGIAFTGTVTAMDLSGMAFLDCRFDRVVWANVKFDDDTLFERCHFAGGIAEATAGLGRCRYVNCTWDDAARAMIGSAQTREGKRTYTRDDLKSDMGGVVRQLVNRGGLVRTVDIKSLGRGRIRHSKFRKEIIDGIRLGVLEPHEVAGVRTGGFKVRSDVAEAVGFFVNNGVMTGPLKKVYERLVLGLGLQ